MDNCSGREYLEWHKYILQGLIDEDCNVVSIASDGASTEREVQRKFVTESPTRTTYVISHPAGLDPIKIDIPIYHGHHITPIQDSKHVLKFEKNGNMLQNSNLCQNITCVKIYMLQACVEILGLAKTCCNNQSTCVKIGNMLRF